MRLALKDMISSDEVDSTDINHLYFFGKISVILLYEKIRKQRCHKIPTWQERIQLQLQLFISYIEYKSFLNFEKTIKLKTKIREKLT